MEKQILENLWSYHLSLQEIEYITWLQIGAGRTDYHINFEVAVWRKLGNQIWLQTLLKFEMTTINR